MSPTSTSTTLNETEQAVAAPPANWVVRATLLYEHRRLLGRVTAIALLMSLGNRVRNTQVLRRCDEHHAARSTRVRRNAACAARWSLGRTRQSGQPGWRLALQSPYRGTLCEFVGEWGCRRSFDRPISLTAGLSQTVSIHNGQAARALHFHHRRQEERRHHHRSPGYGPVRAQDMAQAYLDDLNSLLTQTSTSSAHQERIFIESRFHSVGADLERAQLTLSEFSSKNSTIDIKEQTRGLVDAEARVQGELLVEQAGLQSLCQIYGGGNMRGAEARIAALKRDF